MEMDMAHGTYEQADERTDERTEGRTAATARFQDSIKSGWVGHQPPAPPAPLPPPPYAGGFDGQLMLCHI
ncbi:hypothetical protein AWZ03_009218 [Drosophila navojoa]|uniref:Uncharacterized protein n=1 Tax=Drosophila navojoa TaxID=7232 RepID=A0A484B6K6_DRONA|nr:hypothetical protein AWZ03_009218 [Drosophila navojoa]